jgi:hypothetical protein
MVLVALTALLAPSAAVAGGGARPNAKRMSDREYWSNAVQYPTSVRSETSTKLFGFVPVKLTSRYGVHTPGVGNKTGVIEDTLSVAGIKLTLNFELHHLLKADHDEAPLLDDVKPVDPDHFLVRTRASAVSDWMLARLKAGRAERVVTENNGEYDRAFPGARDRPRSRAK